MDNRSTQSLTPIHLDDLPGLSSLEDRLQATRVPDPPDIDGYTIISELGHGGMGRVWKARQHSIRRNVAIKMMHEHMNWSIKARKRFDREIDLAARLEHPNIAAVYESDIHRGMPYYTMQLVEGESLDQYVAHTGLSEDQLLDLFQKICIAVQYAHRHQVLHRDLKPSNIMVTPQGEPVILDFGLAKGLADQATRSALSRPGTPAGTPMYMAPEQASSQCTDVDTRSDVYSLGVILYRLITKHYPHDPSGSESHVRHQIIHEEPIPPSSYVPKLNRELETIILSAIERDPEKRYGSPGELAGDLKRYQNGEPLMARRPTVTYVLAKRLQKHRLAVSIASVVLALLLGTAGYAYVKIASAEKRATRTLARLHVRNGVQATEQGDLSGSLVWFTEALRLEPTGPRAYIHRARIGSTLRQSPKLIRQWGHVGQPIIDASLSTDGHRVVTVDASGAANLWDVGHSGHLAGPMHHGSRVKSIFFKSDNTRIITVGVDASLNSWDARTGKLIGSKLVHDVDVRDVAYSHDGRYIATGSSDGLAKVWDVTTGQPVTEQLRHFGPVLSVGFDPANQYVLTAGMDGAARVWDIQNGSPVFGPLRHHGYQGIISGVNKATFTPDGRYIITAGGDRLVIVWDAATGKQVGTPMKHPAAVTHLSISHDSRYAVAGCADGAVRVWHIADQSPRTSILKHDGPIRNVALCHDGSEFMVASADGTIHTWNWISTPPEATVIRHGAAVTRAILSSSGHRLLSVGNAGVVRLWSRSTNTALPHNGKVQHVTFSPDGNTLATGTRNGSVYLWRTQNTARAPIVLQHSPMTPVRRVIFSHDGKWLASASWDQTVRVWDISKTNIQEVALLFHSSEVHDISFSQDDRRLAAGQVGRVSLWDTRTWLESDLEFKIHGVVHMVRFAQDGDAILAASHRQGCRWNLTTGQLAGLPVRFDPLVSHVASDKSARYLIASGSEGSSIYRFGKDKNSLVSKVQAGRTYHASFSPNPQFIATAGWAQTQVWSAQGIRDITPPLQHEGKVYATRYSPDGRLIVTCGGDKTARVWDSQTGEPVTPPLKHEAAVSSASFSRDGRWLATIAADTVRVWDISPADESLRTLIKRNRQLVGHQIDASGAFVPITDKADQPTM